MKSGLRVFAGLAALMAIPLCSDAQSITALSLSAPTSLCAQDVTARVTLSAPAPATGLVVQLSSSVASALSVPGSLAIPGGATFGTATLRCTPSTQAIAVVVTAAAADSRQTAILNVLPPALERLSLKANESASRVVTSFTGAATLAGPVPVGGVIVTLTNDQPALATVPPSVTIAAGSNSANFTVSNLRSVSQPSPFTITGTGLGVSRAITATLTPPTLTALLFEKVNPTSGLVTLVPVDTIPTGVTTFARLQVGAPTGSAGLVLNLSSSNASVATVPSTVTVPAGDSTVRVPITSGSLAQTGNAIITASLGTTSKSATVVVSGVILSSVVASTPRVIGGQTVQGTVNLDRPAPAGGVIVQLGSTNASTLRVPSSVTVPAGARSAPFTASTAAVTANSSVTISAVLGATTKTVVVSLVTEGISNFSTTVTSVRGGTRVIGKIAAHPGHDGFSVVLSSPSPEVLSVPARVDFAPGELVKAFAIVSTPVRTSTSVTLTARVAPTLSSKDLTSAQQLVVREPISQLGTFTATSANEGISRTTTVTVTPPMVSALTLTPVEAVGGSRTVITGTITLDGPAPADYAVRVTSSSSVVGPSSDFVRVLAGETTATFTARTLQVTNRQDVTLKADGQPSITGGSRGATVTVLPR